MIVVCWSSPAFEMFVAEPRRYFSLLPKQSQFTGQFITAVIAAREVVTLLSMADGRRKRRISNRRLCSCFTASATHPRTLKPLLRNMPVSSCAREWWPRRELFVDRATVSRRLGADACDADSALKESWPRR